MEQELAKERELAIDKIKEDIQAERKQKEMGMRARSGAYLNVFKFNKSADGRTREEFLQNNNEDGIRIGHGQRGRTRSPDKKDSNIAEALEQEQKRLQRQGRWRGLEIGLERQSLVPAYADTKREHERKRSTELETQTKHGQIGFTEEDKSTRVESKKDFESICKNNEKEELGTMTAVSPSNSSIFEQIVNRISNSERKDKEREQILDEVMRIVGMLEGASFEEESQAGSTSHQVIFLYVLFCRINLMIYYALPHIFVCVLQTKLIIDVLLC